VGVDLSIHKKKCRYIYKEERKKEVGNKSEKKKKILVFG